MLDFGEISKHWRSAIPDQNEFAYIPAGTFQMGDHTGEMHYAPVHAVTLDSFYMGRYEIATQQYCDFLNDAYPERIKVDAGVVYGADDSNNSYPYCSTSSASSGDPYYGQCSQINFAEGVFVVNIKDGTTDMSDHPMVLVGWHGCAAYCNWRSSEKGLETCYDFSTWDCDFTKNGFRLPTEAEWEYAARGGEYSPYYRYPWGDSIDESMANYGPSGDLYETGSYPWTTPVGYYDGNQIPAGVDMANGYGLYDMAGNVFEWCNDWFDSDYYDYSPTNNPTGPSRGSFRIIRGGSWSLESFFCRSAPRMGNQLDLSYGYGFRIVLGSD